MAKKTDKTMLNSGIRGNNIVQKSLPLASLWQSDLTLPEFKILDVYLSRINSMNTDARTIRLEKGELEQALGVKRIQSDDLITRLKRLMGQVVEIIDDTEEDGAVFITLFERAKCLIDMQSGEQKGIELECTNSAMKYFFNVEKIGYFRYKLRSIIDINSRYSYIMFLWLESNRWRKTFEVNIEDLKNYLSCNNPSYSAFKEFNRAILSRCQAELLEKTDIRYTYEPIKKGRKVVAIRFKIETLSDFNDDTEELQSLTIPNEINDPISFLADACGNEFTDIQMQNIFQAISQLKFDDSNDIELSRYHFLSEKYSKLNVADERAKAKGQPIKNRFSYFSKLIIS